MMGNGRKLNISRHKETCIVVNRGALKEQRLVYIAIANKALNYPYKKSKIVYIGTTKKGVARIASSAAIKSKALLNDHGINTLRFYVVRCDGKQRVETWKKLERGLIVSFKHLYGMPPKMNKQGVHMNLGDVLSYFTKSALEKTVEAYSDIS